jgi:hypothetical protein
MKLPSSEENSLHIHEYPSRYVALYEEVEDVINYELYMLIPGDPKGDKNYKYECKGYCFNFGDNSISKFSHTFDTTNSDFISANVFEIDYVDLQSVNNIAKKRLNAVVIKSQYPNELSLKYLDHIVKIYSPKPGSSLLDQYMRLAQLYSYISLNMELLNISEPPANQNLTSPGNNNNGLLTVMIQSINEYINLALPPLKSYFTS